MGRILKCEVFFLAHRNPKQANCITRARLLNPRKVSAWKYTGESRFVHLTPMVAPPAREHLYHRYNTREKIALPDLHHDSYRGSLRQARSDRKELQPVPVALCLPKAFNVESG